MIESFCKTTLNHNNKLNINKDYRVFSGVITHPMRSKLDSGHLGLG